MAHELTDAFRWYDMPIQDAGTRTDAQLYQEITRLAGEARGHNPNAFDALTAWILDDAQWGADRLAENRQILMQEIIGRFKEQNERLRACLSSLQPADMVNKAVFATLDRFDSELSGECWDSEVGAAAAQMFSDFSAMQSPALRARIAGSITGPTGTDHADFFGYINVLKECDAAVQWTLFMPDVVKKQQDGFKVESFECRRMPAIRFIGREYTDTPAEDIDDPVEVFRRLDAMAEYRCGFDYDMLFMHHYGKPVDIGPWHGFWGRFMKADTPVPEGFVYFDLIPKSDDKPGAPFISEFTFAVFSGDQETLHKQEGFDSDAMYDVTRNIMLGQDICIPYPDKYWTAEVCLNGYNEGSTAYAFSAQL